MTVSKQHKLKANAADYKQYVDVFSIYLCFVSLHTFS